MSSIILALSESHGRWARTELARQGIEVRVNAVCTMAGRSFEGRCPEAIYVYAPLNPGVSLSTLRLFTRSMAWARRVAKKNPGTKIFRVDTDGAVREWPEAL